MTTTAEYSKKPRLKAVVAVYLLLTVGERILLARRQNTGYQDGNWNVPSGHVEGDELPTEAIVREAKEEVGLDFSVDDMELVHMMYRPQHDPTGPRLDLFFVPFGVVRTKVGEPVNAEPEKCAEIRWFNLDELPENTVPHVRHAIEMFAQGEAYSELGLEWLKERGLYKL